MTNRLYYGDNLQVLRQHVQNESIDLVYLDPPFKSDEDYNVLFAEHDGTMAAAQIKAFGDTWRWNLDAERSYHEIVESGGRVSNAMQAFRTFLGQSDMMAYLAMMAPRLVELHRVLKATGSIYLHCDPAASHYLKMLMDAIFRPENFRNEIIWRRTGAHGPRRSFGPIHDTILFYSKSGEYFFEIVRRPYMKGHVDSRYTEDETGLKFTSGGNVLTGAGATKGESGQAWRGFNPSKKGRHWAVPGFLAEQMPPTFEVLGVLAKLDALYDAGLIDIVPGAAWPTPVRYLRDDDGHPLQDIWAYQPYTEGTVHATKAGIDADVMWLGPTDPERLGYPTQKPLGLLRRIIKSSCPADGIVLDPFCGCGTAIVAAEQLHRKWIGIDITHLAITLIKNRLFTALGTPLNQIDVVGEPVSLPDAVQLASDDRYQFQWWALGLLGARPTEQKKGRDQGVDGRLFFHDSPTGSTTKQIIFSVKSGHVKPGDVRDLRGVLDREKAAIGVLITLEHATNEMKKEAISAGFYESPWGKHARIQILTIEEILDGAGIDYPPPSQVNKTFKQARRYRPDDAEQMRLK